MSRNLCSKVCCQCGYRVAIVGKPYVATSKNVTKYHVGMIVADAECVLCGAKYTAWIDDRKAHFYTNFNEYPQSKSDYARWCKPRYNENEAKWAEEEGEQYFFDLSFRSTFDDEPGDEDLGLSREEIERVLAEYRVSKER